MQNAMKNILNELVNDDLVAVCKKTISAFPSKDIMIVLACNTNTATRIMASMCQERAATREGVRLVLAMVQKCHADAVVTIMSGLNDDEKYYLEITIETLLETKRLAWPYDIRDSGIVWHDRVDRPDPVPCFALLLPTPAGMAQA